MGTPVEDGRIAALAFQAGFRDEQLVTAVAVALAESGGDPAAHNPRPPDDSYGLWQINMIGSLGPARRSTFGIPNNAALFDPAINAKAAWEVSSHGTNWRPWSAFTSGKYRQYLERAQAATTVNTDLANPLDYAKDKTYKAVRAAVGDLTDPFLAGVRKLSIIGATVMMGIALVIAGAWRGVKASA
jgi:hypothetical protein